jgi:hypothetical protein
MDSVRNLVERAREGDVEAFGALPANAASSCGAPAGSRYTGCGIDNARKIETASVA